MLSFAKIRPGRKPTAALATAGAVVALVALSGFGGSSASDAQAPSVGQPPPEWAANAGAWPAHNHDLANTRATTQTPINSQTVSQLKVKWSFRFKGSGAFGVFASTPISLNGTVYLQDLNSNVYALDRSTGRLKWKHAFNKPSVGPNGVAFGNGRLYGATETNAFALDPQTGNVLWSRRLIRNKNEGIDMTPQLYDGTVLISTIPGNTKSFYAGNGDGIVWALDAATGKPKWKFNTLATGAKLWGHPDINSGGGLWYPPAVDSQRRVFISVANPAPLYGTRKFPNGSSRRGPNLYTNSIVALDGQTGKRLWFRQALPHDVRDYDLQIPAILATVPINGVQTDVVMVAGKMGKAFAYRAADGKHLWTRSVGKHQNDTGRLPRKLVNIFPGDTGGVETPMAFADNRLFVPWLDFPTRARATGLPGGLAGQSPNLRKGRGGLTAVDPASGKVLWQNKLPSPNFGAATVANDVVFTSTYAGTIYAYDTQTGNTLWTTKAPAGINSFPAIDGDTLLVGAGTPGFRKNPKFQLIAYSLQ
jgi:outer membrane protein assembly factor BamB